MHQMLDQPDRAFALFHLSLNYYVLVDRNFGLVMVLRRSVLHDFVVRTCLHSAISVDPKDCAVLHLNTGFRFERL